MDCYSALPIRSMPTFVHRGKDVFALVQLSLFFNDRWDGSSCERAHIRRHCQCKIVAARAGCHFAIGFSDHLFSTPLDSRTANSLLEGRYRRRGRWCMHRSGYDCVRWFWPHPHRKSGKISWLGSKAAHVALGCALALAQWAMGAGVARALLPKVGTSYAQIVLLGPVGARRVGGYRVMWRWDGGERQMTRGRAAG